MGPAVLECSIFLFLLPLVLYVAQICQFRGRHIYLFTFQYIFSFCIFIILGVYKSFFFLPRDSGAHLSAELEVLQGSDEHRRQDVWELVFRHFHGFRLKQRL